MTLDVGDPKREEVRVGQERNDKEERGILVAVNEAKTQFDMDGSSLMTG